MVVPYIIAQMIGAFLGGVIVWIAYRQHFEKTENADLKLAVFCTGPAIRDYPANLVTEIIGTFTLVFGVLSMTYFAGPKDTPAVVGSYVRTIDCYRFWCGRSVCHSVVPRVMPSIRLAISDLA